MNLSREQLELVVEAVNHSIAYRLHNQTRMHEVSSLKSAKNELLNELQYGVREDNLELEIKNVEVHPSDINDILFRLSQPLNSMSIMKKRVKLEERQLPFEDALDLGIGLLDRLKKIVNTELDKERFDYELKQLIELKRRYNNQQRISKGEAYSLRRTISEALYYLEGV